MYSLMTCIPSSRSLTDKNIFREDLISNKFFSNYLFKVYNLYIYPAVHQRKPTQVQYILSSKYLFRESVLMSQFIITLIVQILTIYLDYKLEKDPAVIL